MRVGVNLLYLLPGLVGGTETYATGLLDGLVAFAPTDEFVVFLSKEAAAWPIPASPNVERIVCPVTALNRARRYLFEQTRLPALLRRHRVDLVHSLAYVGPIVSPCPTVVTIHDTNYVDLAKTIAFRRRLPLRLVSTLAARNAEVVITDSQFSKQQLIRHLRLADDTVRVIYAAHQEEPFDQIPAWPVVAKQYDIREPYLVAFGGGAIHKNTQNLLRAFALVGGRIPHRLVLIGRVSAHVDWTEVSEMSLRDRVIPTGYIPRSHVFQILRHSELFVLPSLYEGFGLPVLEAQQADVAVACSTAGALPEVAGDGAVYFDPGSPESMAAAISECVSDADLRTRLRAKGRLNLERFSWQKAAAETRDAYLRATAKRTSRRVPNS